MSTTDPVAPPPVRRNRKPAEAPAAPSKDIAHPAPAAEPEEMLTGSAQYRPAAPDEPRDLYLALMGLGRAVDPETDLETGPNRFPRYVVAAIRMVSVSTGRSRQQVAADALTGRNPLPTGALDRAYAELYGKARPAVDRG